MSKQINFFGLIAIVTACLFSAGSMKNANANSGDVTDDIQPFFICSPGVNNATCPGRAMAVWADVDGIDNGTVYDPYETMVTFYTATGNACGLVTGGGDKYYSHSYSDLDCLSAGETSCTSDDSCDRGRFVISFVDMTAAGFDQTNSATWVYKSVPSLQFSLTNTLTSRPGVAVPYHQAKAYKIDGNPLTEPDVANLIDGTSTCEAPGGGSMICEFSDPDDGIKEIWVRTDYIYSNINNFVIHSPATPGVTLLFDGSGSMSWSHEGDRPVPVEQQRIDMAKRAAAPFLDELLDHGDSEVNIGIARFPRYPYDGCNAETLMGMTPANAASHGTANGLITSMETNGSTSMLAGLQQSLSMLEDSDPKTIVLLSDGYHNCPSTIESSDPAYTDLVNSLTGVKVYTIGFSRPGDIDRHFLDNLATDTGGYFHDVTGALGFDPDVWHPATALAATYNKILADGLGLDVVADPKGTIAAGETKRHEIAVNSGNKKISFFLSWAKPQQNRLSLSLKASDGNAVETETAGVRIHTGESYHIVTVDQALLQQPGKVTATPWILEISAGEIPSDESEHYQYSVIADSALKMRAHFDKSHYRTGDVITLTARVTEASTSIKELETLEAQVTRPSDGLGNWFAAHKVNEKDLEKISANLSGEKLPAIQRKAMYLTEIDKITMPAPTAPQKVTLHDDGSHGDATAGDGLYTGQFSDTVRAGTYSFLVQASGKSSTNDTLFQRERFIQKHISVTPSAEHLQMAVVALGESPDKVKRFLVTVTPKDALDNYMGPIRSSAIAWSTSKGNFTDAVKDHLDGSYSRTLTIPINVDESTVDLSIKIEDMERDFNLSDYVDQDQPNYLYWFLLILLLIIMLWFLFRSRF